VVVFCEAVVVAAVRLKISLRGVRPPVWRRLVVPASFTLAEVHSVFQTAMGWTDSHLHCFDVGGVLYGDVEEFDGQVGNETRTRLSSVARSVSKFGYEYDFGDGWEHDVLIEQVQPDVAAAGPFCMAGRRACPPEDCGGPWGYEHLLEVLADPGHEEHAQLSEWVGGDFAPNVFDLAETNDLLRMIDHTAAGRPGGRGIS
jgi:pRiA4b ORF-3-like protein